MVWHWCCGQGLAGCAGCAERERENSGIKLQMELLQLSEVNLVQLS